MNREGDSGRVMNREGGSVGCPFVFFFFFFLICPFVIVGKLST